MQALAGVAFTSAVAILALVPKLAGTDALLPAAAMAGAGLVPPWGVVTLAAAATLGGMCFGLVRLATRPRRAS
jgi:hypothetical protein